MDWSDVRQLSAQCEYYGPSGFSKETNQWETYTYIMIGIGSRAYGS